MSDRIHVVILGAGFAGLWAARRLAGAREDLEVTLVERNNFHTFFPLLYQVGAAELEATDIAEPVRKILRKRRNLHFRMAEVRDLDLPGQWVHTDRGSYHYDHLLVATGSTTNYFGVDGAAEHSFPLRTMEEGLALRNRVLSRLEEAAQVEDSTRRRQALRFVIVGGGFTGVEYAGALAELLWGPLARDFPDLAPDFQVILLEMMDRLLPPMPERLGRYAEDRLREMGVDVRLGATVERVSPDTVTLEGGETISTQVVCWTAGVQGDPDAERWGLPAGRNGRIGVRPTLEAEGLQNVWVAGDLAYVERDGEPLPMIAPVATQQGEHVADNILRRVAGDAAVPFRFRDRGMLATVGRNKAVAHVLDRQIVGFPAWVLWLLIHIVKLVGFRNRLSVLVNWAWDYIFFEKASRLILPFLEAGTLAEQTGDEGASQGAGADRTAGTGQAAGAGKAESTTA